MKHSPVLAVEKTSPLHPKHAETTVPIASHHCMSMEMSLATEQQAVMVKCTLLATNTKTVTEKSFSSAAPVTNNTETKEPMMIK